MKYNLIKIAQKIKKITNFNILNETPEYLIIGVKLVFKEMAQKGHDNKYCFQPYSAVVDKSIATYFYVAYWDKRKEKYDAPVFWVDHHKIDDLENSLKMFIQEL